MKITQTDNQMEIKTNGNIQVALGLLVLIIGIIILVTVLSGIWKIQGNGQSTALIGPIVGAVFVVGGAVGAFLAKNKDSILQKGGTSTVSQKRVLFGGPKVVSFDTSRIRAVCLFTQYRADNNINSNGGSRSGLQRSSQLSLMLDDNSLVQIAKSQTSGGTSVDGINVTNLVTKAPLSNQANQIAQFLGVPLQSSGDTPNLVDLGGVINSVVDAVHENAEQKQVINDQPTKPVEPTLPSENTNWQN